MDIIIANILFWTLWYFISLTPFLLTQYVIDNYEDLIEWKEDIMLKK